MIEWIKKQWHVLTSWILTAIFGVGILVFNNGQRVEMIPHVGVHLLAPTYDVTYANNGKPIELERGDRYVSLNIVMDSTGIVKQAFADTLDVTEKMSVLQKFTQCKK